MSDFLDLRDVDPRSSAERAADATSRDALLTLFQDLETANSLWQSKPHGERRAAEKALDAINKFIAGTGEDRAGRFGRPLLLLAAELRKSGKPLPGNILAPEDKKQTPKRNRAQPIQYLQAASAFAAEQFKGYGKTSLPDAYHRVGELLRQHRFPPSEFSAVAAASRSGVARGAKVARLSRIVREWRKECVGASSKASAYYHDFQTVPPCDDVPPTASVQRVDPLGWLRRELEHAGHDAPDDAPL